ncbi:MAG: FAD-binding oxidoreductase [bacterium]|nr:FAD-binding oxidoreductase [bacterium]
MILFDRYAKLKKQAPNAIVHSGQKQLLAHLSGTLRKNDLPELIVEPTSVEDLQAVVRFAAEKEMRVALACGQSPTAVAELEGAMLILTHRLAGPSQLSKDGLGLWVYSGTPLEAVAVELAQRRMEWTPLHPVEPGETMGTFIAQGVEGVRCHRAGGVLSNIRRIEWIGFDGERFVTGPGLAGDGVDVAPLLFGSGGRYGIITRIEIALQPAPETRTLVVCECDSVDELNGLYQTWQFGSPMPVALPFWTKIATNALRQGNDDLVTDAANAMLACEWDENVELDHDFAVRNQRAAGPIEVNQLWQHLFRLPRTLARLFPYRTAGRFRLPADALCDFDERVNELARDRSLSVAVWGTLGTGHVHTWVLRPDEEARTARRAAELLDRLAEDSLNLGGCPVVLSSGLADLAPYRDALTQSWELTLLGKCDPHSRFKPHRSTTSPG